MQKTIKVSDTIARVLKDRRIKHVFGIIGSANSHIFDSIQRLGYTEIVCVHHEQAATMAMQAYYRTTGDITAALVTAGAGSSNAITGVLSAWADSYPGLIISGQENTRFINQMQDLRMWGIQGYDSTDMVRNITKYQTRVTDPKDVLFELEKSFHISGDGRPGPVWVDFPMDIQGALVLEKDLKPYVAPIVTNKKTTLLLEQISSVEKLIRNAKRPVFWFGQGVRLAGAEELIEPLLKVCRVPTLLSWAGLDMLQSSHPMNFGQAGVYGHRAGNFIVQNADLILAVGNRLAIPMIGYEHAEFARNATVIQVDIDPTEFDKVADLSDIKIIADAKDFITKLLEIFKNEELVETKSKLWLEKCADYTRQYPRIGPEHADTNGFINSYRFLDRLCEFLKEGQHITTDTGTALLSGHQAMRLRKGQRLMTSTGLGEMGCGLPAAIGVSVALNRGNVICLNCDGGIMMNIQELQTMVHHNLPIKIFIFNNDGYLMIKHTQKNLFNGRYSSVNSVSGVSCPDFGKVAASFDIKYYAIEKWNEFDLSIEEILDFDGPVICDVFMDPEQFFHPKLTPAINQEGVIVSPPLEDLSPLLPRKELKSNMLIGLHEKSEKLLTDNGG